MIFEYISIVAVSGFISLAISLVVAYLTNREIRISDIKGLNVALDSKVSIHDGILEDEDAVVTLTDADNLVIEEDNK